ncbi:hypothetical protein B6U67_04475 [Methanosarcinales archaeon ex4484_138]|nr:MAG: hypothetical protein B6U67_04475 [Methanosarcinales archaeon ex4484_138]
MTDFLEDCIGASLWGDHIMGHGYMHLIEFSARGREYMAKIKEYNMINDKSDIINCGERNIQRQYRVGLRDICERVVRRT